ncbi:unnamed protein product, partial [Mycena citricolor]
MPSPTRIFALTALFLSATASTIIPPGHRGTFNQSIADPPPAPQTQSSTIINTTTLVQPQKGGPAVHDLPSANVPPVTVTALDGTVTNATVADAVKLSADSHSTRRSYNTRRGNVGRFNRREDGFKEIFAGLPAGQKDASIEGLAYLTYTVVPNSTYNVDACLKWAQGIPGAVFVNLYYEFNNYLLDFVFSEKSNLKCAAYGDIHNATEKTNFGGQASYPTVACQTTPLTRIEQSSGWGLDSLIEPDSPEGYDPVFGPTNGANNAPGYMGFAFLDQYDVNACAQLCNGRGADPVGGGCAYFNIWRAVVSGVPTTYTCSMYYIVADESTAVNYGQGDLVVTYSRGYKRKSLLPDGGFEGYTGCTDFCFTLSDSNWVGTSASGGSNDATIFHFNAYAQTGNSVALLGAAFGDNAEAGTLAPAQALSTKSGVSYVIQCFMNSAFSAPSLEASAHVDITWNGPGRRHVLGLQRRVEVCRGHCNGNWQR